MNVLKYIEMLRKDMKLLKKALIAYLIVLIIYDVIIHIGSHGHFLFDNIPGFWTLFGIIGCFVLIKVAKGAAHTFLGKNEDYYG